MNGKLAKKLRRIADVRSEYLCLKERVLKEKRSCATPAKLKPQPVTAGTVPSKFKGFRTVRTSPSWNVIGKVKMANILYPSRWVKA